MSLPLFTRGQSFWLIPSLEGCTSLMHHYEHCRTWWRNLSEFTLTCKTQKEPLQLNKQEHDYFCLNIYKLCTSTNKYRTVFFIACIKGCTQISTDPEPMHFYSRSAVSINIVPSDGLHTVGSNGAIWMVRRCWMSMKSAESVPDALHKRLVLPSQYTAPSRVTDSHSSRKHQHC